MDTSLTQSSIVFPERRIDDWYTQGQNLGSGSFGTVRIAIDDRDCLLRLKYTRYTDEPLRIRDENLYLLETAKPSVNIVLRARDWKQLAEYLSTFSYDSILDLQAFMFPYKWKTDGYVDFDPVPISRWLAILDVLQRRWPDEEISSEKLEAYTNGVRELVAVKLMKSKNVDQRSQEVAEKSAKTEVYAFARVASDTEVWFNPEPRFNTNIQAVPRVAESVSYFGAPETKLVIKSLATNITIALIELNESETFRTVKARIQEMTGIPAEKQRLLVDRTTALPNELSVSRVVKENTAYTVLYLVVVYPPVGCVRHAICLLDYFYVPVTQYKTASYYVILSLAKGPNIDMMAMSMPEKMFPAEFVWYVAWAMSDALDHVHSRHVIHNDIKPGNIIYDESTGEVSLIDFGLSCHTTLGMHEPGSLDSCDATGGTIDYSTIEQQKEGRRYTRSDIWALGVVLWELATGYDYAVPGLRRGTIEERVSKTQLVSARPPSVRFGADFSLGALAWIRIPSLKKKEKK